MRVSVLCTVYNAGAYLQQAIDSVLAQTYGDWELLVTDDGSTDPRVGEILHAVEDERVSVTRLQPTASARAATCRYATHFNRAFERSTGDYITYLCGDDYYMPARLERMVVTTRKCFPTTVAYGSQLMLDDAGRQVGLRPAEGILRDAYHRVDLNSVMHSRGAFAAVGGWPTSPDVWRDADAHFWRRLTDAGYVFVPVDGDEPTDAKHYRSSSVDMRVQAGLEPWA